MTREELYEHVWSTPIHLLAEGLGLSDVGLAKTCAHLEIPRPGRGYWARLDAGERVEKLKLPPRSEHNPRGCEFNVADNRKRRAEWAADNLTAKSKGYSVPPIALPEEQQALHEVTERHREAMERAKRDEHGFVHLDVNSLFRCSVSLTMAPKLVRAIDALLRELEKRNCQFVRGDKDSPNLQIGRGKERLTVRWREELEEIEVSRRLKRSESQAGHGNSRRRRPPAGLPLR